MVPPKTDTHKRKRKRRSPLNNTGIILGETPVAFTDVEALGDPSNAVVVTQPHVPIDDSSAAAALMTLSQSPSPTSRSSRLSSSLERVLPYVRGESPTAAAVTQEEEVS